MITENCPACFEEPKERARIKALLKAQENLHPQLFYNIVKALQPLMSPNIHPSKLFETEMKHREAQLAQELEDTRNLRKVKAKEKAEAAAAAQKDNQSSSSSAQEVEEEQTLSISFD